jgi:glucosamine-phosphate N-acetyltransferase
MHYTSLSILCNENTIQDVMDSYFRLLTHLTVAPVLSVDVFIKAVLEIQEQGDIQVAYTVEDGHIFIHGTATLLYETKLIRGGKKVGHIEDVVVSPNYRDQGIAKRLISNLTQMASESCYKVILDCTPELIPFYEKCNFEQKGIQMAHYFK